MTGDCHVRFCERLRVKFPLPTRPPTVSKHYSADIQGYIDDKRTDNLSYSQ
jgi:hypothetical protein